MSPPPKSADDHIGGVNIGEVGSVGGDIVGRDKIVHGHTKEEIVAELITALEEKGVICTAEAAGLERQTIIKIAQELRPHESLDFDQAIKELERAVIVALEVIERGERGADHAEFINVVLAQTELKRLRKHVLGAHKQVKGALGALRKEIDSINRQEIRVQLFIWRKITWTFISFYTAELEFLDGIASNIRNKRCLSWLSRQHTAIIFHIAWEIDKDARSAKDALPIIYGRKWKSQEVQDIVTDLEESHHTFVGQLRNHIEEPLLPNQIVSIFARAVTRIEDSIRKSGECRHHCKNPVASRKGLSAAVARA